MAESSSTIRPGDLVRMGHHLAPGKNNVGIVLEICLPGAPPLSMSELMALVMWPASSYPEPTWFRASGLERISRANGMGDGV